MKKSVKVIISLVLCIAVLFAFAACSGKPANNETEEPSVSGGAHEGFNVGIIQYSSNPSLDNCTNGIKKALNESGLKFENIDLQIGSDSAPDSDCKSYAESMVAKKYDMIFAVATPAATVAYAATEGTDIPVIFCAVSDPVEAKLVDSMEVPGGLCTGTSDKLDLDSQVDLIEAMQPDVKSIGILYTTSEANSISQLNTLKEICSKRNIEVVATGIQNESDIPSAAAALSSKVDCINNFTDNKVVINLPVVLGAANNAKIPVYGSEIEQVYNGCLGAISIDYDALGRDTGKMGIAVLEGQDISKLPVKTISEALPVINKDVAKTLGLEIPEQFKNAELVTSK